MKCVKCEHELDGGVCIVDNCNCICEAKTYE